MTFKYMCTSKLCSENGKVVKVKKCPCHCFTKEYCEVCEARLDKYKAEVSK